VVRREYNANGTMRSETQRIRTYAGLDTTAHVYRLEYTYDLNGRRKSLKHPAIFEISGARETGYGYDTIAGALARVHDPNGGGYTYRYDLAGRLDERKRGSVVETFNYDSLGRLEHRTETSAGNVKHDDHLTYKESTGKLVGVTAKNGSANLAYTGMGALAYSDETDRTGRGIRKVEQYSLDALGNQHRSSIWSVSLESTHVPVPETALRRYETETGRLIRSESTPVSWLANEEGSFDPSGNRIFSVSHRVVGTPYTLRVQDKDHARVNATASEVAA
jgi:YD repeat-containing protein